MAKATKSDISGKRTYTQAVQEPVQLLPPDDVKPLFQTNSFLIDFIKYMEYSELIKFRQISKYYEKLIYFNHPGSRTHKFNNITELLSVIQFPQFLCISNALNLKGFKKYFQGENKIKYLDISEKEISTNIFSDLNMNQIEELVITYFPKNFELLENFKNLKKFTIGTITYIDPMISNLGKKHFKLSNYYSNPFIRCSNNSINGIFEVINTGGPNGMPYRYFGHIKNNRIYKHGIVVHENGDTFFFRTVNISNSASANNESNIKITGEYRNLYDQVLYICETLTSYPDNFDLNYMNWKINFPNKTYYTGKTFYGMLHDSDIMLPVYSSCAKIYYPNGNVMFEGSMYKGLKKNGKNFSIDKTLLYDGSFVNNKPEGNGVNYFNDSGYYKGEFREGKANGNGAIYDKDNIIRLKGEFRDWHMIQGEKHTIDKYTFSGRFEKSKIVFGTMYKDSIRRFEGFFSALEKPENGTYYFANGNKQYSGSFQNGIANGNYKIYEEDNTLVYDGNIMNNEYNGKGIEYIKDVGIYEGEFVDGVRNGFFISKFDSGHIVEGAFIHGSRQGSTKIIFPNGKIYEGEFFTKITETDNSDYIFKYNELELISSAGKIEEIFKQLEELE